MGPLAVADLRGAPGMHTSPGAQILSFSCSSRPKKIGWHAHFGSWRRSQENPGSATVIHSDTFLTEQVCKVLTEGYLTLLLFVHQLTFGLK